MRQPLTNKAPRREEIGQMIPRPAPVAGWNARDPQENMAPEFALALENFFPSTADIGIRKGFANHLTGVPKPVKSLMTYASTTTQALFAVSDDGVYNSTTAGAVGALQKALTNGLVKSINMNSLGGSYLFAVNSTDDMIRFDGTTWASVNAGSGAGIAITGHATNDFSHIAAHKRRMYFIQKNSMSFWYLPVNTIAGAVAEFPLGQVFPKGGKLVQMGTWTIDGGSGIDDYAVFYTSEGELAIYKGSDPNDANSWALVGVYFVGKPVGTDCLLKYEGDLLLLTQTGVYPLTKALQSTSVDHRIAFSNNIEGAFLDAVDRFNTLAGWNMTIFPEGPMLIVNVPTVANTISQQYVMNTTTKAWCKFTGMNALCWAVFNKQLYFGGSGTVYKAWNGFTDLGRDITAYVQCAYDYLSTRGKRKRVNLVQPHLTASGDVGIALGLSVDFEPILASPLINTTYAVNSVSLWDTAVWGTSKWTTAGAYRRDWKVLAAKDGYAISFRMQITNNKIEVRWTATDYIFNTGSIF